MSIQVTALLNRPRLINDCKTPTIQMDKRDVSMTFLHRQDSADHLRETLQNKVVLLIGGTKVGGPALAASLAERGADVAVVYFDDQHERAERIKQEVEANGQRCLTFAARPENDGFPEQVISRVVDDLGRLDVFIDYAAFPQTDGGDEDLSLASGGITNPFSNFEMMAAALGQLTDSNGSSPLPQRQPVPDHPAPAALYLAGKTIHKKVMAIDDGSTVGRVEDFYVDAELETVAALYLGREGLLDRSRNLIPMKCLATLGEDAVLVPHADVIEKAGSYEPATTFVRRTDVIGLDIQTPGGTRIGRVGDLIINEHNRVAGFLLSHTYVSGPIADKRVIDRTAITGVDLEAGVLTANLLAAEATGMKLEREGLFGDQSITRMNDNGE